jgi:hypothetical protein
MYLFTSVLEEHTDFSSRVENQRGRQYVPLKCQYTCTREYSGTSEKTGIIIVTDIRNPNLNITAYFVGSQNTFSKVKIL